MWSTMLGKLNYVMEYEILIDPQHALACSTIIDY